VESDVPNPLNEYGHSKLAGERANRSGMDRPHLLAVRTTGRNFVRTMPARSAERDEVRVVADQLGSPTYVGHLATATKSVVGLPPGLWHVAADGQCTWAEFAAAIFEEAGAHCRVVPISSKELNRPAPDPAYSVLRSERPEAPRLPYWREGLRDCLARL
jgi:dTDP-4-dehydrorhamnose reductase